MLLKSIVRIFSQAGAVVGSGFLCDSLGIITCAHVVLKSLGLADNSTIFPQQSLSLDFPDIEPNIRYSAYVSQWSPPRQNGGDIAYLRLEKPAPTQTHVVELTNIRERLYGHTFKTYGFPVGFDNGVYATGRFLDIQAVTGWIQLEDIKEPGKRIEPGFSGAPVWDEALERIVGMIVASDRLSSAKTAFMLPIYELLAELPELTNIAHVFQVHSTKRILVEDYAWDVLKPLNLYLNQQYNQKDDKMKLIKILISICEDDSIMAEMVFNYLENNGYLHRSSASRYSLTDKAKSKLTSGGI